MKFLLYTIITLFLISCGGNVQEKDKIDSDKNDSKSEMNFDERAKREIEAKLSIPSTEKYNIQIHKEYLNSDDLKDAIILVNRLEFAKEEAKKETNSKRAEFGYMGNYNYFFYYDGKLDKISIPMIIASSAKAPLSVKFENVQSEIYKDVLIEYRIRNSAFRNYYLIENGTMQLVFQWKLFDLVGNENYEANYLEYQNGSLSLAKDIIIYKGKIKNYSTKIGDVYTYNPTIEKDGGELYRFFFDPKTYKYMTKNRPIE